MLYSSIVKKQNPPGLRRRQQPSLGRADGPRSPRESITASAASTRSAASATTGRLCACGSSAWRASCPTSISRSTTSGCKGRPWHTMVFVQWDGTATLLDGGALLPARHARDHPAVGQDRRARRLRGLAGGRPRAGHPGRRRPRRGRRRTDPELARGEPHGTVRRRSNEGESHAADHSRNGEQRPDRDPLRGPRQRGSRRDGARLPAERELVGAPGTGAAGARASA